MEKEIIITGKDKAFYRTEKALHDLLLERCQDAAPNGYEFDFIDRRIHCPGLDLTKFVAKYRKIPPPLPPPKPVGMRGPMIGYHHPRKFK